MALLSTQQEDGTSLPNDSANALGGSSNNPTENASHQSELLASLQPRALTPSQLALAAVLSQGGKPQAVSSDNGQLGVHPKIGGNDFLAAVHQEQQRQDDIVQACKLAQMSNQLLLQQRLMAMPACANPVLQVPLYNQPMHFLTVANPLLAASLSGMAGTNIALNAPVASAPIQLPSPGLTIPEYSAMAAFDPTRRMKGGVIEPFPEKLHRMLCEVEASGMGDIISFVNDGTAFEIHQPKRFFEDIVPRYFRQSRLSSFKRQLNLYGFELHPRNEHNACYSRENFRKDRPDLARKIRRTAVKTTALRHETGPPSRALLALQLPKQTFFIQQEARTCIIAPTKRGYTRH